VSVTRATSAAELIKGDCLAVLASMPEGSFELAYLDPPFNTGDVKEGRAGSFVDRWPRIEDYMSFLTPRLAQVRRVLTTEGAILVHCDWRTSHHVRLALDGIFGADGFVNHLIWSYGLGGSSPRRFARKHDDIFYYACSDRYFFEAPRQAATSRRLAGRTKKQTDVLTIPSINNMAKERTGWPTQKPVELLELLVRATCPPRGRVLDPFCGSGTTLVAASRAGCSRIVGVDVSAEALEIANQRLAPAGAERAPDEAGAAPNQERTRRA